MKLTIFAIGVFLGVHVFASYLPQRQTRANPNFRAVSVTFKDYTLQRLLETYKLSLQQIFLEVAKEELQKPKC